MSDSEKSNEQEPEQQIEEASQEEEKVLEKITVSPKKKEKDPKRVAQGKRLAQISKAAKEKKMREKIAEESQLFDISVNYSTVGYVVAPVVVFLGMYLYFSRKTKTEKNVRLIEHDTPPPPPKRKSSPKEEIKPKSHVVSLFD